MAFDDKTRGRLQKLVTACRGLLTDEFRIQVQQTYGLDPNTGDVTPLERLTHLSAAERETADLLRQTLAHYLASEGLADSATQRVPVIDRIVREQAFTVLNRLAALLMMEARGVLQRPAVGSGQQSPAFELYKMVAGSALGETGQAYQTFLFSLFDEFAQELPALFDRFAPQGRLFPREAALLQVLAELNHHEIQPLWGEDETIGWIYQYFNSKEERKAMRDASQAPRNSRELAVRNQFFTPRYVVEFLVDNTLGRLWLNATGGQTGLRERCQSLLVESDKRPAAALRLRDPRTLKLLDPACGSMHFGLYAFDLFLTIYREAWDWEQTHGAGSLDTSTQRDAGLQPLCNTYTDQAAYLRDVPRLVIEHNIYGVDIDQRAAQIASLALWLRAQRAWNDDGVKAKERPAIGPGNVIAATAPPAEDELRNQIAAELDARDAELFTKALQLLKGVPELGVLLQVERELPQLVRSVFGAHGSLFKDADEEQWRKAEDRLRAALTMFSRAATASYQGRLFVQDALQGLRIIDLCREVFDVAVMNPPFGEAPKSVAEYIENSTPGSRNDIYAAFVMRLSSMLRPREGKLGAITSRAFVVGRDLRKYRAQLLQDNVPRLTQFLDLGSGVLDGAMVETAAYILDAEPSEGILYADWRRSNSKNQADLGGIDIWQQKPISMFNVGGTNDFLFGLSSDEIGNLDGGDAFSPRFADVTQGLTTDDDERFVRLRWEVPSASIGLRWQTFAKGGEYAWFTSDLHLVVNRQNQGAELVAFAEQNSGNIARARRSSKFYGLPAAAFSRRSQKGFSCRRLREGSCFSDKSGVIFPLDGEEQWLLVLPFVLASAKYQQLISAQSKFGSFEVGAIKRLPRPDNRWLSIESVACNIYEQIDQLEGGIETSSWFVAPLARGYSLYSAWCEILSRTETALHSLNDEVEGEILRFQLQRAKALEAEWHWSSAHISYAVGVAFGRWDLRCALGERILTERPSALSSIPKLPPGQVDRSEPGSSDYSVTASGIIPDDPGHTLDIVSCVQGVLSRIWGDSFEANERDAILSLEVGSLREWFRKPSNFFGYHLGRYSKSRRSAPIYWPISTASGSYTLWLYYPGLSGQTLYTAINDFVEPKLQKLEENLDALRARGGSRTRGEDQQFEALQGMEDELLELRDKLQEIARGYKPNQDDGVQICAAPLWPLFRHKPWQKVLQDTWVKLEKGEYDWAHLAMAYWPERVREKCKTDKSLAIAHGLEDLYVEPEAAPKKTGGRRKAAASE